MNVCNKVLFSLENVSSIFYFPQKINLKQSSKKKKSLNSSPKCLPFFSSSCSGEGPFIHFILTATAIHTETIQYRPRTHIHHSVVRLPHRSFLHRAIQAELWNSWQRKNFTIFMFCSSKWPLYFFDWKCRRNRLNFSHFYI